MNYLQRSLCSLLFSLVFLSSQGEAQIGLQAGLGGILGIPQNEFADQVNLGAGFGGEFLYAPPTSPFAIGLRLNYVLYGSDTRREPFSTTIPDVQVDVTTQNQILLGHVLLRIQAKSGPLQPYVEGLLGFNYLYTSTKIEDVDWDDDENDIASSTNFDDSALSYGFGGGCMIRVWQGDAGAEGDGPHPLQVFVDLRGTYLAGGEAEYLKKGSIRRENSKVTYDVKKSRTDLFCITIGASVAF